MTRARTLSIIAFVLVFVVAAPANPQPLTVTVPDRLKPDANVALTMVVPAKGVQIYECRARRDQAGEYESRIGSALCRPPPWEATDGSKILGTVKERADAPAGSDAIPWLLLATKSVGADGSFSKVTSVQRVNTVGGVAPKAGCSQATAGTTARVDYTADYYFFTAR
jgi:Protein of unknown function (DUF3455)